MRDHNGRPADDPTDLEAHKHLVWSDDTGTLSPRKAMLQRRLRESTTQEAHWRARENLKTIRTRDHLATYGNIADEYDDPHYRARAIDGGDGNRHMLQATAPAAADHLRASGDHRKGEVRATGMGLDQEQHATGRHHVRGSGVDHWLWGEGTVVLAVR